MRAHRAIAAVGLVVLIGARTANAATFGTSRSMASRALVLALRACAAVAAVIAATITRGRTRTTAG